MEMERMINVAGLETELTLGLPGSRCGGEVVVEKNEKKRVFSSFSDSGSNGSGGGGEVMMRKSQVVGWPPVRASFRGAKMYVKVSMDGAPFLRKVDLSMHKGYTDLVKALQKLFACSAIGEVLKDGDNSDQYIPIYEDKDGDWMLLGDVPWEMFTGSCKRLRIMKKSDAKGTIGLHAKDLLKGLSEEE